MFVPRLLLAASAAALVLAGCGGDGDDDSTGASETPAEGGELFTQTAGAGTLAPVQGKNDVFTLTLSDASKDVTQFTDRPVRSATTESLEDFVNQWATRGFADDPPNAALVLDEESENADTSVFELAQPKYESTSGDVSYQATQIEGATAALPNPDADARPPSKFGQAHLFIDPGSTPTVDFFVQTRSQSGAGGGRVVLTLDAPFTVLVGSGTQEAVWAGEGGGYIGGSAISVTGEGQIDVQVAGGSPPITGTANIPSGTTVSAQVANGATRPVKSGSFSLSP